MCRAIRGVSVYINLTIEIKVVSGWVLSAFNYIGILVDTNTQYLRSYSIVEQRQK